ncbi:MAG: tetratricopeptide repeat protein [Betaproteobacteria bacterium]
MRPISLLFAIALGLSTLTTWAQTTAPTVDPREMSEATRKAYTKGLKDARSLIGDKKYAEAIVILDGLLAERPREPQARFQKGVALAEADKTDEAIVVYAALVADFPELPEVRNNLAVLYAKKGNYEAARDELVAALLAAPDYVIAYENLGDVYARLAGMNYEKAIARDNRNRTAPPKLQLVRDVLGMKPPVPVTTATTPAVAVAPTVAAPAAAADTPK